LAYVRKKYNISSKTPDTSALGKLGSWYDVEAKRRGYDVPGYTGGAFERSAEESEKQFKERQAFQEKQRQKEEQEFTKTKSAFDFERTLREFDQSVKSQQEMNDPNSQASKSMREVIAGLYGENAVPQNISANQMLRLFPDLKELTKTKLQSDLRRQEEREKFGFEKELKEAELKAQEVKEAKKPTKGEERTDVEFAKKYADWIGEKGSIGADKGIANLETAINEMENNPELTGGAGGLIYAVAPEAVKSALNEKIGMIETRLRSAVVDTLRPLLGAQFAAVEGERIFKQTFDANQPMSENISRAKLVLNDLKNQVESRKKAVDYWENFGTLKGYKAFEPQQPAQKVQTDRVNVRDKNGKRFSIPKRQLERALSEGYEVIE